MKDLQTSEQSKTKHTLTGTVVSDKTPKTRIVEVVLHRMHPKYGKTYTVSKKFAAHDPENATQLGDVVTLEPSKPYSKTKKFIIVSTNSNN